MRSFNPKHNLVPYKEKEVLKGGEIHQNNLTNVFYKAPITPKPLEYKDIDNAIHKYIEENINLQYEGVKVPIFTTYSLQRFSEKQQMFTHSDENGNVYSNFMTITRKNNPKDTTIHGSYKNIPGDKDITYLIRDVLDENGTEHYEVYTMKQPFGVDLIYTINFICTSFEFLNIFNMKVNKLFKSIQSYIKPNGHYIRVLLDSIEDTTEYGVEEQKFFKQTVTLKVPAYIIMEEDFKVKKVPKRVHINTGDRTRHIHKNKVDVCIDECPINGDKEFKKVVLTINFKAFENLVKFEIDDDIDFMSFDKTNIQVFKIFVNDTPYFVDNGFSVNKGDIIKVKVFSVNEDEQSTLIIGGKSRIKTYTTEVSESAEHDFDNYSTDFIDIE